MVTTQHTELDLQTTIRPGLDILANEIVIALKKRTRFVCNDAVYQPGLLKNQPATSLLNYELSACETNHAELGRYTFAAQDAYTDVSGIEPIIKRTAPSSVLQAMPSGVGGRIMEFYRDWVKAACVPGDNSNTYGETVTTDVLALLAIMERVNLGKAVAESKFLDMPDKFKATGGDRDAMLAYIVRSDRENQVLEIAAQLADNYDLAVEHTVSVFRFMIDVTVDIEVDYLRLRISET